jgi:glycerol kinase
MRTPNRSPGARPGHDRLHGARARRSRPRPRRGYDELPQHFPKPGWVEHDRRRSGERAHRHVAGLAAARARRRRWPRSASRTSARRRCSGTSARRAAGTRDRVAGSPHRARCDELRRRGREPRSGRDRARLRSLLLRHQARVAARAPERRARARRERLAFGTVDSWLCGSSPAARCTRPIPRTPRARCSTDCARGRWEPALLDLSASRAVLPEVRARPATSASRRGCEGCRRRARSPVSRRPAGGAVRPGLRARRQSKNTYGTGCFLLLHTGPSPVASRSGLLTTVACDAPAGRRYALEAACSWRAPRCSGCATGSGWSRTRRDRGARALGAGHRRVVWCRRSPVSVRPTGGPTCAARCSG